MTERRVTFPKGLAGLKDFPRKHEGLFNMFNTGRDELLPRPGIDSFAEGVANCRGQHKFKNILYQVSGQKLIQIDRDTTVTELGPIDITSTQETEMDDDFVNLVIVVKGDRGYFYDGATVQEITDPNYITSIDVANISGRSVFIPEDGGPAFFSDEFDPGTIQAASFFDAETQPDFNTGVINLRERLYILGEETCEPFRFTGTGTIPFARIEGGSVWTGYTAGKVFYKNSFAFLGKDKDEGFGFFVMGSGEATRISSPEIDEILNDENEYSIEDLKSCIGNRFQWKGLDAVAFRLPGRTLAFNGVGWVFLESLVDGAEIVPWFTKYITHAYGQYYTGQANNAQIGKLSDAATDFGERVEFGFDTYVKGARQDYFTLNSVQLDGLAGQITPEFTVGLEMSDDGQTYGERFYEGLGEVGEVLQQVTWEFPGGLGDYESFAGMRFRTAAPVRISSEGVLVDI